MSVSFFFRCIDPILKLFEIWSDRSRALSARFVQKHCSKCWNLKKQYFPKWGVLEARRLFSQILSAMSLKMTISVVGTFLVTGINCVNELNRVMPWINRKIPRFSFHALSQDIDPMCFWALIRPIPSIVGTLCSNLKCWDFRKTIFPEMRLS